MGERESSCYLNEQTFIDDQVWFFESKFRPVEQASSSNLVNDNN